MHLLNQNSVSSYCKPSQQKICLSQALPSWPHVRPLAIREGPRRKGGAGWHSGLFLGLGSPSLSLSPGLSGTRHSGSHCLCRPGAAHSLHQAVSKAHLCCCSLNKCFPACSEHSCTVPEALETGQAKAQKSPDTPLSPEGNTEGPGTASSEPLLPS